MEYRQIEARKPWSDQPRVSRDVGGHDQYKDRFTPAIAELREALADGRYHRRSIAEAIARKHRLPVRALCDRAGVYHTQTEFIWIGA